MLLSACGQVNSSPDNGDIIPNALYLNSSIADFTATNQQFFYLASAEINDLSKDDILFQKNGRVVSIKFGDLADSLLGLTECTFYNDPNKSYCQITLSQKVNIDLATSTFDVQRRTKLFSGVLRHELGHAFGMGHNLEDANNLMYPIFSFNHVDDPNVFINFINNLSNFRFNGKASGLRTILDDK